MIGDMLVEVEVLPRTGDRVDTLVTVAGPGETKYQFPLSITGTIQAIWNIQDAEIVDTLKALVYEMFSSIVGTASAPPENGYWFDSYNSEPTVKATLDRMRNLGQVPYLKNPTAKDQISSIYGGGILSELERIDGLFFEKTGMKLVRPLDYTFERSQAEQDLGSPPTSNADFLYRICILSVIIDGFNARKADEKKGTGSLKALTNWLQERYGLEKARSITAVFARVKDLRKQYPIHEHFIPGADGQKKIRDEVEAANAFFKFRDHDDYAAKWKNITDAFKSAIAELESVSKEL
ncbi:MAG: hypothetical protein PVI21_01650 [Candidatus Woesebacteria bacterium]|jgi:hypothetical protein